MRVHICAADMDSSISSYLAEKETSISRTFDVQTNAYKHSLSCVHMCMRNGIFMLHHVVVISHVQLSAARVLGQIKEENSSFLT